MPQIKFTDTTIGKLKVDAITWYSGSFAIRYADAIPLILE